MTDDVGTTTGVPRVADGDTSGAGGPRVVDLTPPDSLKARQEEVRRTMPTLLANAVLIAQIRRANYLALINEGFNEVQALDLCWR